MTDVWYFIFYSFFGFLLEVAFARATRHPKRDRKCFLLLPLCPVYGLGAILIRGLSTLHSGILWTAAAGFAGATAAELGMGLLYRHLLKVEFWDYSACRHNVKGLVCLRFSLYWTVLGLLMVYGLDPLVLALARNIPDRWGMPAVLLLASDTLVTALALRREGTTEVLQWYRPGGALGLRRKTNGGR